MGKEDGVCPVRGGILQAADNAVVLKATSATRTYGVAAAKR